MSDSVHKKGSYGRDGGRYAQASPLPLGPDRDEQLVLTRERQAEKDRRVRLLSRHYALTGLINMAAASPLCGDGLLACDRCGAVIDLAHDGLDARDVEVTAAAVWCVACTRELRPPAHRRGTRK